MDRETFRNKMLQYKLARENNPLLKYWEWKNSPLKYLTGSDGIKENISRTNSDNLGGWSTTLEDRLKIYKKWDPTFRFGAEALFFDNVANGEEDNYWATYMGILNRVPPMNLNAKTPWDNKLELIIVKNGLLPSQFVGTTKRMDLNILALADTLNLGKISRNYSNYKDTYKDLPDQDTIDSLYKQAKEVLNNPGKYILIDEQNGIIRNNPKGEYERNPLGMLKNFGLRWLPDLKALYMHDTYDFPKWIQLFSNVTGYPIDNRPSLMKIRSKIGFDPKQGSIILRDSTLYNNNFPELYKYEDGGTVQPSSEFITTYDPLTGTFKQRPNYSAGFVSGADPIASTYVEGVALGPVVSKLGKVAKTAINILSPTRKLTVPRTSTTLSPFARFRGNLKGVKKSSDTLKFYTEQVLPRDILYSNDVKLRDFINDPESFKYELHGKGFIPENILGLYNKAHNKVLLQESVLYSPKLNETLAHEFRHKYDTYFPRSRDQEKLLDQAYKSKSTIFSSSSKTPEKIATNTELRRNLYDKYIQTYNEVPNVLQLDSFIDELDNATLLKTLGNLNSYGLDYATKILKGNTTNIRTINGKYITNKTNKIKNALKFVPATTLGLPAINNFKSNYDK